MSTPPNHFTLLPKGGSADHPARAMGRVRQIYAGSGTYWIIPSVEPWPYVNDANGHAYPGGIVGVRIAWHPGLDDSLEVGAAADFFALIPVPVVPPSGYTYRFVREFFYNPGSNDPSRGGAAFIAGFDPLPPYHKTGTSHRMRIGPALHDYWATLPECHGDGAYHSTIGGSGWGNTASAGLRYIQWKNVPAGITVELRCNANGSSSGTGDTQLATYTNGGGSPADSPFITAGLQFALGVKRMLYFKVSPSPPDVIDLYAGPRVDLPLPFLATGPGSLIAPGGYVPAKLDVKLPT